MRRNIGIPSQRQNPHRYDLKLTTLDVARSNLRYAQTCIYFASAAAEQQVVYGVPS
jgi:phosphatidylethanolamine-binding protein (PEBP) family uncharacterized protein